MIEEYNFGYMKYKGKVFRNDLIITPEKIISNWWRDEGHHLKLNDLKEILNEDFDVLVIGQGYSGAMDVSNNVFEYFSKKGVEVISFDTRNAVSKFNEEVKKGRRVVGAFHLTC